ncbi:NADPH-dependent ferric siderophore reductase, contains FAD-binding and SIP domains [Rhizobium sp. NFR07]|uniref:siderophore-interacting protein n=1 Tax=Rhizobium sp. NFR07 TaxID=1566262 RepID=UPI0008E6A628|nr:siderophore-interacting protein [Rhizobium sp. NFR07]SFB27504.1 NADPH-dependent ferric siderophore reductase, contains FAD-binding and SIP domains [Rhizobium sp. NFR07]
MLHQTKGRITRDNGAAIDALKKRALEWDVPLTEEAKGFCFHVWNSKATLIPDEMGVSIEISSPEQRLLQTLQGSLTELFEECLLCPKWDEVAEGALAPGMSLMQVVAVTKRSEGFTRVRLEGHDAERFGTGSYHFRLLIPRKGRPPCWPRIAASGRTVWPEGDDALNRPCYTTVAYGENWLEFDIFRHDGSPTSDWAAEEPVGRTVGIIGPGGGACPENDNLVLFGDETAMPAIIRMLQEAPGNVRAFLQVRREDLCELAADARVSLVEDMGKALEEAEIADGAYVWFAGHADKAKAARAHLIARGVAKKDFTAAAYWS